MQAFENLFGADPAKAVAEARKILVDPRTLAMFQPGASEDEDPWLLTDQALRSINYHDHSWDMLDPVLSAFSQTGEREYLDAALALALGWCRHFGSTRAQEEPVGERHMAWYDMAVGLRAYRLAYLLDAAAQVGAGTQGERDGLSRCLDLHARYLADDRNIKFHNNHGLFQAAGQLAMGRRFAERSRLMRKALKLGEERVEVMLRCQFADDGVHLEHSPDYHRMVHRTARMLVEEGLIANPQTIEFIDRIERALSWFILPNGHVANLGDSDYNTLRQPPAVARDRWRTGEMQFAVTGGAIGTAPPEPVRTFQQGGYHVARFAGDEGDRFATSSYLLQQAGFHSRTHKHADTLSFVWCEKGTPILVDAGRYGYIGKTEAGSDLRERGFWYSDRNRVYVETTRAHNCLEFDGQDYPRRNIDPPGSLAGRHMHLDDQKLVAFETEARHDGAVRHVRLLILCAGQWLICLDWYEDLEAKARKATQWFHFAPAIELEAGKGGRWHGQLPGRAGTLHVCPLTKGIARASRYRGHTRPFMQGWWSPGYRQFEPNDAVGFVSRPAPSKTIATLFSLSSSLAPDVQASFEDGARAGSVRWEADGRVHKLVFARPPEGDLDLRYAVEAVDD